MHPLDGVWAKLDRGDEHVKALDDEIEVLFSQPNPPGSAMRQELDRDDSSWVITMVHTDPLPTKRALLIGDAIHNFRTALDQLVFELAFMDTGGTEVETTQFPASTTLDNFRSEYVQTRLLSGLTHRATIKRFQPYRRWVSDRPHPLTLLNDLSNDDKHRLLQPVLIFPQELTFHVPPYHEMTDCEPDHSRPVVYRNIVGRPLEPDTEVFRLPIRVTGPAPDVDIAASGRVAVGFRNGVSALDALPEIARFARQAVAAFEPEFERPTALRLRDRPRYGRFVPPTAPAPAEVIVAGGTRGAATQRPMPGRCSGRPR
jgi:hypothetical protein